MKIVFQRAKIFLESSFLNKKGFTLIELSITLLLLSLILAIALPRVQDLTQVNLKSSSRKLAGTISYIYNKAALSKNLYRIYFDLKNDMYWIEICAPNEGNVCEWKTDTSQLSAPVKLPRRIHFEDIMINGEEVLGNEVGIFFFPQGFVIPTIIHLRDERKRSYSLIVNSMNGKSKIYDKYVIEEKNIEFE